MPNNISRLNNMDMEEQTHLDIELLDVARSMKRRPSYVQNFCILQCVTMSPKLKVYQVARTLGFDYYQAMKRVTELSKKGFIDVTKGGLSVTKEGIILKEILARLIAMMHATDQSEDSGHNGEDERCSAYNGLTP